MKLRVNTRLTGALKHPSALRFQLKALVMEAAGEILVAEAVEQAPRDVGDLVGEIKAVRVGDLSVEVASRATSASGELYGDILQSGSGSLRGARDYGYTSGRVRGGDVARGIGGIRPNKFMARTKEAKEDEVIRFVNRKLKL